MKTEKDLTWPIVTLELGEAGMATTVVQVCARKQCEIHQHLGDEKFADEKGQNCCLVYP